MATGFPDLLYRSKAASILYHQHGDGTFTPTVTQRWRVIFPAGMGVPAPCGLTRTMIGGLEPLCGPVRGFQQAKVSSRCVENPRPRRQTNIAIRGFTIPRRAGCATQQLETATFTDVSPQQN